MDILHRHIKTAFLKASHSLLGIGLLMMAGGQATAAIVSIPVFTGSSSEGFESFSLGYVSGGASNLSGPISILGGAATLSGEHVPSYAPIYVWDSVGGLSLGGGITAIPYDGTQGITANTATAISRIDFATPATMFGGYWATAFNGPIDFTFYDSTETVIASETVNYSLSGELEWFGWMSLAGDPGIAAVEWSGYYATVDGLQTDVSAVPIPAAVWLFGSGLIGMISLSYRKRS